jgi:hypothetical protein
VRQGSVPAHEAGERKPSQTGVLIVRAFERWSGTVQGPEPGRFVGILACDRRWT